MQSLQLRVRSQAVHHQCLTDGLLQGICQSPYQWTLLSYRDLTQVSFPNSPQTSTKQRPMKMVCLLPQGIIKTLPQDPSSSLVSTVILVEWYKPLSLSVPLYQR